MTIAPAPMSASGDSTTAASVPSGEKAGLKRSWVGSRATSLPHSKSVLIASTQMPYGKGEDPDLSVRTIREPSQPVSTTARAEASRALPSGFMTAAAAAARRRREPMCRIYVSWRPPVQGSSTRRDATRRSVAASGTAGATFDHAAVLLSLADSR